MGKQAVQTHREVEFKFRVPTDFDLTAILRGDFAATEEPTRHMTATYFDTTAASLLRWGITMRHRTGGSDDGWHLKIPMFNETSERGATKRNELHSTDTAESPPAVFMSAIAILLRDADVVPLARVETVRRPFIVAGVSGDSLEVVSDHVKVFHGDMQLDSFHEIEIELIDPHAIPKAHSLIELLLEAGATPSSVSKAAAAFGPVAGQQPDIPLIPRPKKSAIPYDLVRWVIAEQARKVIHAEIESHIKKEPRELICELHKTSELLRSLHFFLDSNETELLLDEITWLLSELASPHQLSREHEFANHAIALIEDPLDRHEAQLAIDSYFARKSLGASSSAVAAQRSDRYLYLFNDLMDFAKVPPVADSAFVSQKFWKGIEPDSRAVVATAFQEVFPKKARKILGEHSPSSTSQSMTSQSADLSLHDSLRRIALDSANGSAGAFALGFAAGRDNSIGNPDV
jgi:inorganic triphosphatase YgiF